MVRDPKNNFELYQLYRWVLHQRMSYKSGKLSPERIEKLNKINFIWNQKQNLWNKQFEKLQKFIDLYNRFPTSRETFDGKMIGQWYWKNNRFYQQGKFNDEQMKKWKSLINI